MIWEWIYNNPAWVIGFIIFNLLGLLAVGLVMAGGAMDGEDGSDHDTDN